MMQWQQYNDSNECEAVTRKKHNQPYIQTHLKEVMPAHFGLKHPRQTGMLGRFARQEQKRLRY
eukprot:12907980-Prorocentrum_lima.AAC.1